MSAKTWIRSWPRDVIVVGTTAGAEGFPAGAVIVAVPPVKLTSRELTIVMVVLYRGALPDIMLD